MNLHHAQAAKHNRLIDANQSIARGDSVIVPSAKPIAFTSVADSSICRVDQFSAINIAIAGLSIGQTTITIWFADQSLPPQSISVAVVPSGIPSDSVLQNLATSIVQAIGTSNITNFAITAIRDVGKVILSGQVAFDKSKLIHDILVGTTISDQSIVNQLTLVYSTAALSNLGNALQTQFLEGSDSLTLTNLNNDLVATGTISPSLTVPPAVRKNAILTALNNLGLYTGRIIDFISVSTS